MHLQFHVEWVRFRQHRLRITTPPHRPILLLSVERLDCDEPKAMLFRENVRLTSPSNIHEVHNSELIFLNKY